MVLAQPWDPVDGQPDGYGAPTCVLVSAAGLPRSCDQCVIFAPSPRLSVLGPTCPRPLPSQVPHQLAGAFVSISLLQSLPLIIRVALLGQGPLSVWRAHRHPSSLSRAASVLSPDPKTESECGQNRTSASHALA